MAARVACFGKLPFHREFLRIGLDSPGAAWVVHWLEQAHVAWSRTGNAPATSPLVRFAAPVERALVIGVVRQSSDGLRRHPVALFTETTGDLAATRPELVPIACEPTWTALAALLDTSVTSVAELTASFANGIPAPDLGAADATYMEARAHDAPGGAWAALAGPSTEPDGARHLALNLVTAAQAQRAATSAADGVAFSVPIADDPATAARQAAFWLALFGGAAARSMAPPVMCLRPDPGLLVAFYRPPDGRDLAAVLTDPALAPIDDLREPWQTWPPSDGRLAAGLDALVGGGAGGFAHLLDSMRALGRS
jgi:hypothetical protein